ncbi:hypothetical protein WOLCODRAFT_121398 [Wolfiporia cocos MD-104 SS10]|uniref:Nucleoporin n=1 Tax=Wolfiporia cocos (strain MD-104) TaxID=742152 RepID=A0A2H3JVU7_WOLCO|nr:hypothetical protein WOLCODRAFT_121398 [Wolfiporia cocos MD-104 SS10]
MASLKQLRTLLVAALSSRGLQNGEQDVFEQLMVHKPQLLSLYDVGARSPQEQRELESGKIQMHGRSVVVNPDFARQTIFISQQLDCSERYVAEILRDVMTDDPHLTPERAIESAILEFHRRRRDMADCLRYMLEAADAGQISCPTKLFSDVGDFVRQDLLDGSAGSLTLPERLFQELYKLGDALGKAQTARQNARSDTVAPSAQSQAPSLGADVLSARCESLKYERRNIATALYFIGRMGYLSSNHIAKLIDWLDANPRHSMTYYVLSTVLAAFDTVDPTSIGGRRRQDATEGEQSLMAYMKRKLDVNARWHESGLKATVLLKWTLYLTEMRRRDPSLEAKDGFRADELETQVWNAVQGDCFTYLLRMVAQMQKKHSTYLPVSFASTLLAQAEHDPAMELPADDFKPVILEACELLVRSLITLASSELRKIKQRQEDVLLAGTRNDRSRLFRSTHGTSSVRFSDGTTEPLRASATPPRNDMAVLFALIGLLYATLPPERALHFWGGSVVEERRRSTYSELIESRSGKLPAFLQWAVWSTQARDIDLSMALYDMLGGLAKGEQCSELAYNFLARGGGDVVPGSSIQTSSETAISWGAIFALLDSWVAAGSAPRNNPPPIQPQTADAMFAASQGWVQPQPQLPPQQLPFTQQDVLLAQSFLRLLSTVVSYSVAVRVTITSHAKFRAIPTLVSLVPLGIPLELKGAIFETLAAFCEPGAGAAGVEICRAVWTLMERVEVINVRASTGIGGTLPAVKGVEVELEEVESVYKMYPATIPFLKLLSTLVHTPKSLPFKERYRDLVPTNTIPDGLGHPHRRPGIGPFASFVIDNVFSRIGAREYLRPSDRWRTNDLCLCFVERCLASFPLETLVSEVEELQPQGDELVHLALHPGFDIMHRMLTPSPLQNSILSYLVEGLNGFDRNLAEEELFFRTTITRVLRIIHRVLEIQDIFLDVLLPVLSDLNEPVIGEVPPASYYTRLDQALSYSPEHIPSVGAYINYLAFPELALLSVKILTLLAASPSASQLVPFIDRSDESERILDGFRNILDLEVMEDVEEADIESEQSTGAGAPDVDESTPVLEQAIRVAVLELFLRNTNTNRPFPNIAHLLLFGSASTESQIQDPHALGSRRSCIHSILDMLNEGIPRLKGKGRGREQVKTDPLFVTLPALAERCYHIVYQLCKHSKTSDFIMRYLRTREDFFARHLAVIPFKVPSTEVGEPFIEVLYNDSSRVITTVSNVAAFLRLRSWIIDLVALELHVLTNKGHQKSVADLLELLFGNEEDYLEDGGNPWEIEAFKPFREVGQSHLRMIEFIQSLDFDWSDSLAVQPVQLEFLGHLNLHSCIRVDESGCEVVDRNALLSLLAMARHTLHLQQRILTPKHLEQLQSEMNYVLESCAVENHRREVRYAAASGYESWRRLLDMCLMKCFERLPYDRRENMLFDLLHIIPLTLRSSNVDESTAVLLAETMLSTITKLREDRHHQVLLQSAGGDIEASSLPAERLYALLHSILECIMDYGHLELVRGNLYAALVNYLQLVMSADAGPDSALASFSSSNGWDSLASLKMLTISSSSFGGSHSSRQSLVDGSLAVLRSSMDRLVASVSRDAIDGIEIWKTVAFTLLDSLVRLSHHEKQPAILHSLVRHGFLSGFIQGLKESDLRLQDVLKPDPDDMNTLFVYESKMSMLIRMTQTRQGAERLLECKAIPVLAECEFLDARPEADQAFVDQTSFLPSAIQRYHQLFLPALQLVSGILMTLGPKHNTAVNHVLRFLTCHRDTIVLLLKNEVDELSLSVMEEVRLIVTLSASVLQLVPRLDLASNSGFGGIHLAILALAARCVGNRHWSDKVQPQTSVEFTDASIASQGFNSESRFRATVRYKDQLVRKSLITYLGNASEFTEEEFTLVLSPIVATPRQDDRPARFLATMPTIGDAIEAVSHICDNLANSLKYVVDLSNEIASRDHIRVDNVHEIVPVPDSSLLDNLDVRQKQILISRELDCWRVSARRTCTSTLNALEMVILLLWRHLEFYGEGRHINNPDLKTSIPRNLRVASAPDGEAIKSEAARKLVATLQRLRTLELTEETLGKDWQSYESYMNIMARRIEDAVGLAVDELEATQDSS